MLQGGPDALAAEVRYHRSCYAVYTDKRLAENDGLTKEDTVEGVAEANFWGGLSHLGR